ncbi:MAG TPA: hypothetical protein VJ965_11315, partial [Anaerolineales bacterium]|nr:hypothetical protein [Anaerolineales bacterium]
MDQEQIEKQLKWFEEERREDKKMIASLQKRVDELEEVLEKTNTYVRDVDSEVTKVGVRVTKMDSFNEALEVHRKEVKKELDAIDKRIRSREKSVRDKSDEEIAEVRKLVIELEKPLKVLPSLQKGIDLNKAEFPRFTTQIDELKKRISGFTEKIEKNANTIQVLDE